MPTEYLSLTIMTILFLFAWFPVSIGKSQSFGAKWLASNRTPPKDKELAPWAARCDRAYNNLKDYFPAFIVAILVLGHTGRFDQSTAVASIIFVVARVGHYVSYGYGYVLGRAICFFAGLFANTFLLGKILF